MYKASEFMSLLCCRAPRGEEECQHGVMGNRPSGNLALSFNALGQWMHQIAQHTAIELDNVTAKMMHHDTLIGSLVLVQAQFRNPAKDQQAVVSWGPLWLLLGHDELVCSTDGGGALVLDQLGSLEIQVRIAGVSVVAPLSSLRAIEILLNVLQRNKQRKPHGLMEAPVLHEKLASKVAEENKNVSFDESKCSMRTIAAAQESWSPQHDFPCCNIASIRVTVLSDVLVATEDCTKRSSLILQGLHIACVPQSIVIETSTLELQTTAMQGIFRELKVRFEHANMGKWQATLEDGVIYMCDAVGCAVWCERCLQALNGLLAVSPIGGNRVDTSCFELDNWGSASVPSLVFNWTLNTGHYISISLQGCLLSMAEYNAGVRSIEVLECQIQVDGSCVVAFETDANDAQSCKVESQDGACWTRLPTKDKKKKMFPVETKPTAHFNVDIPRVQFNASIRNISVVSSALRELISVLGSDTSGSSLYDLGVGVLDVYLSDHGMSSLGDVGSNDHRKKLTRSKRDNFALLAMRRAILVTHGRLNWFQASAARISYGFRSLLQVLPRVAVTGYSNDAFTVVSDGGKDTAEGLAPSIIGKYRISRLATVFTSVQGLSLLTSRVPAGLPYFFNAVQSSLLGWSVPGIDLQSSPSFGAAIQCYVKLHNTGVEYLSPDPLNYRFRAIATIQGARLALTLTNGLIASVTVTGTTLFLQNVCDYPGLIIGINDDGPRDIADEFYSRGYAQLATADIFDLTFSRTQSLSGSLIRLDISGGTIRTYCCSDSLKTLIDLLIVFKKHILRGFLEQDTSDSVLSDDPIKSSVVDAMSACYVNVVSDSDTASYSINNFSNQSLPKGLSKPALVKYSDIEVAWYDGIPPALLAGHIPVPIDIADNFGIATFAWKMVRAEVSVKTVHMRLFAGCDWDNKAGTTMQRRRDASQVTEIIFWKMHQRAFIIDSQLQCDMYIRDAIASESISSLKDRRLKPLLLHWWSDTSHPRENYEGLLKLDACLQGHDVALKVKVLPLRCHLDALFVRFIDSFFGCIKVVESRGSGPVRQQCEHNCAAQVEAETRQSRCFIDFSSLSIKLDFKPRGADPAQLQQGALGEFLQVFHLEQVQVGTRHCRVVARTPALAWVAIRRMWSSELSNERLHNFFCGVSLVRPLHAVGVSLFNTIHRPLEAGSCSEQWRSLKRESITCGRVLACESARAGRFLISQVAVILDDTADAINSNGARDPPHFIRRLPDSPSLDVNRDNMQICIETLRSACCEGLGGARDAFNTALLCSSPSNIARGIPVAILRPVAGASRGIAIVLFGVEHATSPPQAKGNSRVHLI